MRVVSHLLSILSSECGKCRLLCLFLALSDVCPAQCVRQSGLSRFLPRVATPLLLLYYRGLCLSDGFVKAAEDLVVLFEGGLGALVNNWGGCLRSCDCGLLLLVQKILPCRGSGRAFTGLEGVSGADRFAELLALEHLGG